MSTRIVCRFLVALFVLAMAWPVAAGDGLLCNLVGKDFKRRNCWPQPFACQDLPTVYAPFAVQTMNGWERQNMIGSQYFDGETGQLTEAGRLKVQWVMFEAPEQYRTLYVRRNSSAEVTASRLNTVREYVATLASEAAPAQVVMSNMPDDGASAARVDFVNRKFAASAPEPKLPAVKQEGSGN